MHFYPFAKFAAEPAMSADPTRDARTILIVDDELPIADVVAELLSEEGYTTRIAIGGDHALAMLERERPDLVLLDLYMPGLSGVDLLARLRADAKHANLPVVVMTAGSIDSAELAGHGATGMISKPFEVEALLETVRGLL
jgi:DNA-binding response OmpR family regulator